ncbi:MAG: LytTR family DNA-binding domain-containing protein [Bacteroidota bacterium]
MRVLVIEDEAHLSRLLNDLLLKIDPSILVLGEMRSVSESVEFLKSTQDIDLILLDIHLNDGFSFEIFEHVQTEIPVIFCTAYDQYAIQAFELNSVDYLLKPIKERDLRRAIEKYRRIFSEGATVNETLPSLRMAQLLQHLNREKAYKKNFLLPYKDRLIPVAVGDIHYFHSEHGLTRCVTNQNKKFRLQESLDVIEKQLDPKLFFRTNRQFVVNRSAIKDIEFYFNGRLLLNLILGAQEKILISKAKAGKFKEWLAGNG